MVGWAALATGSFLALVSFSGVTFSSVLTQREVLRDDYLTGAGIAFDALLEVLPS